MTRSIEVYQTFGALEWCNKYFIHSGNTDPPATIATNIYTAQKVLQTNLVSYTRWRHLDHDGTLLAEGAVTGLGTAAGEMMPIHYGLLIRLNVSSEIGRPSVKYIHGWAEAFQTNNVIAATGITAFNTYSAALLSDNLANSNGGLLTGTELRGFTRRKRMRRLVG